MASSQSSFNQLCHETRLGLVAAFVSRPGGDAREQTLTRWSNGLSTGRVGPRRCLLPSKTHTVPSCWRVALMEGICWKELASRASISHVLAFT